MLTWIGTVIVVYPAIGVLFIAYLHERDDHPHGHWYFTQDVADSQNIKLELYLLRAWPVAMWRFFVTKTWRLPPRCPKLHIVP
jgi:hypothetical protein